MSAKAKPGTPAFNLGDHVRIRNSEWEGPIVELRGPLGPGGALVFRVELLPEPDPMYVEVLEDQLVLVKPGADNRWGIHPRTPASPPPKE